MARVLIVGCGGRGVGLGEALRDRGHAIRGTSRSPDGVARIEAAGLEGAQADPDMLGTLLGQLGGVSVVCWLLGSAEGGEEQVAALHGPRLRTMLERLIDSPARGLVYEAAGTVPQDLLAQGVQALEAIEASHHMPVAAITADPAVDGQAWIEDAVAGVEAVLAG